MASNTLTRRISTVVGGAAVIAMIGFTAACSTGSEAPEQPTTTTTESPLTPTEKSIKPAPGPFTPPVTAPQQTVRAPNEPIDRN